MIHVQARTLAPAFHQQASRFLKIVSSGTELLTETEKPESISDEGLQLSHQQQNLHLDGRILAKSVPLVALNPGESTKPPSVVL